MISAPRRTLDETKVKVDFEADRDRVEVGGSRRTMAQLACSKPGNFLA